MPLFHKKRPQPIPYDAARQEPAVRRSICTGEMTGGFLDRETGKFQDYLLLQDRKGLEEFCESVGTDPETIKTIY